MVIVGLDPGLSGGIAAIDRNGVCVYTARMPVLAGKRPTVDVDALAKLVSSFIRDPGVALLVCEQPPALQGKGAFAGLCQGRAVGAIDGIAAAMRIPREFPLPLTWQKALPPLPKVKLPRGATPKQKELARKAWKQEVINAARRRWPMADLVGSAAPTAKLHDGIADALWLAEWGRMLVVCGKGVA